MLTAVSCSWCGEMNRVGGAAVYCATCLHRADVPRVQCDCPACAIRFWQRAPTAPGACVAGALKTDDRARPRGRRRAS